MDVRAGYKQTAVGVIPEDWVVVNVGEIAVFSSGQGIHIASLKDESSDSPVPVYGGNGVAGYTEAALTHEPTLVVGRVGQKCGEVHLTTGPAWITDNALYPRRFLRKPDVRFLALAIRATGLNSLRNRNDLPLVTQSILHAVDICLPPSEEEQRAIATALSDVDALLDGLDKIIAKKRDLKRAAMHQLLTGQTRLPGFFGEWEVKPLGALGAWRGGMTPSMQNPSYWEGGDFPWISSGDVKASRLTDTSQHVTTWAVRHGAAVVVPENSIVIVTRSGILRKYLPVARVERPMAINQDIKALIPNETVSGNFLLQSLISHGGQVLASCMKAGTTVESVEFAWLKAFTIPIPPRDEQAAIAGVLSEMEAELTAIEARRQKTRALKQAMMQELLTGRTRLVPAGGADA